MRNHDRNKAKRFLRVLAVGLLLAWPVSGFAATLVTHETEKYFYKNGRMEKYDGQFENTYFMDLVNNKLVRTRIYDYQTKKITPDETVYQIQKQLNSHPSTSARYSLQPLIRAVGQPDGDSVELLTIEDDYVHSAVSTPTQLVLSRAKRLR